MRHDFSRLAPLALALALGWGCGDSVEVASAEEGPSTDGDGDGNGDGNGDGDGDGDGDGSAAIPDLPEEVIASVQFTEVAAAAGIDHSHGMFASPGDCLVDTVIPEMEGFFCAADWDQAGAAVADYDADGWPDLYVSRLYSPGILYRNRGDGTFSDATEGSGLEGADQGAGLAWVDVDRDGDQDLVMTTVGLLRHRLFINDGEGQFTDQAHERGVSLEDGFVQTGSSIAIGDFDRDGWVDLYLGDWHTYAIGDQPSHNRLLRNLGPAEPGVFEDVTESAGVNVDSVYEQVGSNLQGTFVLSPDFVDLDGDGWQDLALTSDFDCTRLFWNQGNGTFVDGTDAAMVGDDDNGMGATFADWNRDGRLDWLVTSTIGPNTDGNRLWTYGADRVFGDRTDEAGVRNGNWGWGVAFLDFEHDGDLDVVHGTGWNGTAYLDQPLRAWLNLQADGEGTTMPELAAEIGFTDTHQHRGLVTFDYDRDGDLDVFVATHAGPGLLYRNDSTHEHHHVRVRVRGTQSNVDGLGARVTVTTGDGSQLREVGGIGGYLGHGERVVHFGLGDAETVDSIVVEFPASGAQVMLEDVPVDQLVDVVEPTP